VVKFVQQTLCKRYATAATTLDIGLIAANILHPARNQQWLKMWVTGLDIHPMYVISSTSQYQEVCLNYVEFDEYEKSRQLCVIKPGSIPCSNLFTSVMESASKQSSYEANNISSNDEEYIT
jgi:hypothetical protein